MAKTNIGGGIYGKGISIEFIGATPEEIRAKLERLGGIKPSFLNMPVKKAATATKGIAKSYAPVRTGALRSGLKVSRRERSSKKGKIVYQVTMDSAMNDTFVKISSTGKRAYYPASQNFGFTTRNGGYVEGKRFMGNAVEAIEGSAEQIILDAISKKLDKEWEKRGAST